MSTSGKKKWPVIVAVVFLAVFVIAMVISTSTSAKYHVEVCMAFNGGKRCKNGAASTKEEAQRIATESACSDLGAGGFSNCRNVNPVSVKWQQ